MATVLVVDDEPMIRRMIETSLSRAGHKVVVTGSHEEAILAAGAADVAVLDVLMPVMNGVELLAKLRAEKPGLPAVFISGYTANVPVPPDCRMIQKPFRWEVLISAIADALA